MVDNTTTDTIGNVAEENREHAHSYFGEKVIDFFSAVVEGAIGAVGTAIGITLGGVFGGAIGGGLAGAGAHAFENEIEDFVHYAYDNPPDPNIDIGGGPLGVWVSNKNLPGITWRYDPDNEDNKPDYFVKINGVQLSVDTATCKGRWIGTDRPDSIQDCRTSGVIYGEGGDDKLRGAGGSDIIHGGTGDDRIIGGTGADLLYGDEGNDRFYLNSSSSRDTIWDNQGADTIIFNNGADAKVTGFKIGNDRLDVDGTSFVVSNVDYKRTDGLWPHDKVEGATITTNAGEVIRLDELTDGVSDFGDKRPFTQSELRSLFDDMLI